MIKLSATLFRNSAWAFIVLVASLASQGLQAEDIDLFSGVDPSKFGNPNVLIILDNTSNWSRQSQQWPGGIQQGQAEVDAIKQAITGLGANAANINIGLMEFVTNGTANDTGGFIRYAIRPMTSGNLSTFGSILNPTIYSNINGTDEKRNSNTAYGDLMYDAYNYFAGAHVSNDSPNSAQNLNPPNPHVDTGGYSTNYSQFLSPLSSSYPCANNYIIVIANPNQSGPAADTAGNTAALQALGGNTTQIPLPNIASVTTTQTVTLGTTSGCYSSCNTSEFSTQCGSGGAYTNCTCSGTASAAAACASGTSYYSVFGTTEAGTYNLGYTSTCYSNLSSCKTTDYSSQCTGTGISCTCNGSNTSSSGCSSGKLKYMVQQTYANTIYNNLGYTSSCYASSATCSTADYSTQCASYKQGCSCNTPTTTTRSCPSGQNNWIVTGDAQVITTSLTGSTYTDTGPRNADEWARFLYGTGPSVNGINHPIKTYTIDVYNAQPNAATTSLLMNMANYGGGKYFNATNETAIITALTKIFSEIQAVNSVFSSASLPVSVNTQGTYLNQVFIGMFRPDPDALPRWMGNLKQYQIAYDSSGNLVLADKNGVSAINGNTGFITPSAQSFWTTSNPNYWPSSSTYINSYGGTDESPDGEIVEKGGAAEKLHQLSSTASRTVYTCAPYTPGTTDPCASTTSPPETFNTANTGLSTNLVNWTLGLYIDNSVTGHPDNTSPDDTPLPSGYVIRRSVHGDVVHSRPVAIDFGTGGGHDVKVFYGANDGFLHAISANQSDTEGNELWSFIAPEQWSKLQRLYDNSPLISFPTVTGGSPKGYFFDGPIGHYRSADLTKTWIFPTMRRGGRMVYAFDVSSPASPKLMWRHGCTPSGSCDTGWSQIGQTWSEPIPISVAGYSNPVLIMGGGYDSCEDADPVTNCSSTTGNRVYLIDASNGNLLKTLSTDRAVPANVTAIDSNGDGYQDLAYAADTGGNVYRITLAYNATNVGNEWSGTAIQKIAALGCNNSSTTSCTQRKFLYDPAVTVYAGYNAVAIGSGDREHPLSSNLSNGSNAYFVLFDTPSNATQPLIGLESLAQVNTSTTGATSVGVNQYGWYMLLTNTKEAVVTSTVVVAGYAYFSTFQPTDTSTANSCSANLGTSRGYAVKLTNAIPLAGLASRSSTFTGGGLAPSPVLATVDITNPTTHVVSPVTVIIGGIGASLSGGSDSETGNVNSSGGPCGTSSLQTCAPNVTPASTREFMYWYLNK